MDVDIIALVETHVQPALLDKSYNIPSALFTHKAYITKLSNNTNKLINKHQQGGLLISICEECCKLITNTSCDPTSLVRWQSIDLKNNNGKIHIITAYQGVSSK